MTLLDQGYVQVSAFFANYGRQCTEMLVAFPAGITKAPAAKGFFSEDFRFLAARLLELRAIDPFKSEFLLFIICLNDNGIAVDNPDKLRGGRKGKVGNKIRMDAAMMNFLNTPSMEFILPP